MQAPKSQKVFKQVTDTATHLRTDTGTALLKLPGKYGPLAAVSWKEMKSLYRRCWCSNSWSVVPYNDAKLGSHLFKKIFFLTLQGG